MIQVKAICTCPANHETGAQQLNRSYVKPEGLACVQRKGIAHEADYCNGVYVRYSPDNGRTWGEWKEEPREETIVMYGSDEREFSSSEVWNPVHGHYVGSGFSRYYLNGHEEAYRYLWSSTEQRFFDHQYVYVRRPEEEKPKSMELIRYEEGDDFDPENPRNMNHLTKNNGYLNPITVLQNGDIAVPVSISVTKGCLRAGLDVEKIFPSCPHMMSALLVARGTFDQAAGRYDFTFSEPVILGDLRSSRGICEPIIAELKSGRLVVYMRGSNLIYPCWNTRIEKGTPSFKWYSYSDDGGKTFTNPEPWHFDDGEVIYSSSSISAAIRSSRNGKLYWIGNITDHTAYENWPRYPLNIVEVDDTTGAAKKESLTVIDTRREGETRRLQLSNFGLMEDRETGHLEVTLCKLGQYDERDVYFCESWQYNIDVGD